MQNIYQQLTEAFARRPGLDGVIHGARRVVQGKHGSRSSLFYSAKNSALIPVESNLELSICYALEWERDIQAYRTQPVEVPIGEHRLYPDCCIKRLDGSFEILEIKPFEHRFTTKNEVRFEHLRNYLTAWGLGLRIVGEEFCGGRVQESNRVFIYNRGCLTGNGPEHARYWLTPIIGEQKRFHLFDLRRRLRKTGAPASALEAAIFWGILRCDMHRPINEHTLVEACV